MNSESEPNKKTGWTSLEEFMLEAIENGMEKEFFTIMEHMPETVRKKYRKLFLELKGKK